MLALLHSGRADYSVTGSTVCNYRLLALYALIVLFRTTAHISVGTKLRLYNSCILPIFLYGTETWAVTATAMKTFDTLDQWCLLGMLIEDRKIETRYKFEYSKSSFQTRNSISLFVFLRKPLHKQLETGHLVSVQMARHGVTAQRALSTVTPPQRQGVKLNLSRDAYKSMDDSQVKRPAGQLQ